MNLPFYIEISTFNRKINTKCIVFNVDGTIATLWIPRFVHGTSYYDNYDQVDLRRNPSNLFQFDPELEFHLDYSVEIRAGKRSCPTLVSKDTTRPVRVLVSEDYFDSKVCY